MTSVASDGLPARESGEWASDKLFYVARYMDILTGSMKSRWARRVYADLMSGPGVCLVRGTRREFDGSPILALKTPTPFTDVILVEQDPVLGDALARRVVAPGLRPSPVIRGHFRRVTEKLTPRAFMRGLDAAPLVDT